MATDTTAVRVLKGALEDSPTRGGTIVLRGVLDKRTLRHLRVDEYQREALPLASLVGLIEAFKRGDAIPDIELGVRTEKFKSPGDDFVLVDHVWIIDGQQRVNAALHVLAHDPDASIALGAKVHFGTTKAWEREHFRVLNQLRNKVSPNVLLRNQREDSPGIGTLYGLSKNDKTFVLHGKVSWSQRMLRCELLTALQLLKITGMLHSHKAAGRSVSVRDMSRQIDQTCEVVGGVIMRENIKAFFDILDECWGLKLVSYKEMAPYLRGTFLLTLAQVLSDHHDFWQQPDEKRLFVNVDLRRKLAGFPITDPNVANLTSAGGRAGLLLYGMIRDHINSGKRTKHLRARVERAAPVGERDDSEIMAA